MRPRILLTGRGGQMGRALAPLLPRFGTVTATGRAELDLSRPDDVPRKLHDIAPDIIVNAAALTDVDGAESKRDEAFTVNAESPRRMAEWAKANSAALLAFSTDYVYGGEGNQPHTEDDSPAPLSVYGASKAQGDAHIRASGCAHLILRTAWLYDAAGRNFLTTIASRARTQKALTVVTDQIGAPTSAALLADLLCGILVQGADAKAALARHSGLVHACAAGAVSRHAFAEAIVDGLRKRGVPLAVERIDPVLTARLASPAKRPLNSRLSLERLRVWYGLTPPDWRTALETELDVVAARFAP